jgi:hypothetical protein
MPCRKGSRGVAPSDERQLVDLAGCRSWFSARNRKARHCSDRDLIAVQLDALRAVLEAEKQRTDEWKAVADRFAGQAEKLVEADARRGWWPWRRRA